MLSITVAVLQPVTEPPPLGIWGGLSPIDLLPWAIAVVILIDVAVLASYLSRRRRRNPTPRVHPAPPQQPAPLREAQERMQRLPVIPPHATEADLARLEEEYRRRNFDPDDEPPSTRPAAWNDHPAAWNDD